MKKYSDLIIVLSVAVICALWQYGGSIEIPPIKDIPRILLHAGCATMSTVVCVLGMHVYHIWLRRKVS